KRKVLIPYPLAPASDSPLKSRGNKLSTKRTVLPILNRRRSGPATDFHLSFFARPFLFFYFFAEI
ncbi:MAG: hypothetical protein IKL57_06785, partial [Oscillospiraceae bacterium]|nr:hypothetical protein [Oscillospiraceae bacterium]